MKKLFKNFLSLTLALLLTFSVVSSATAASPTPAKVTSLKSYNVDDDEINLRWKKASGATAYQVYIYTSNGWKHLDNTKNLAFEVDDLASAKQYKFKVRAYHRSGNKRVYGPFSSVLTVATEPNEVENVKVVSTSKSSVSLRWSKVNRATGYQVYVYSDSKGKFVKKATVSATNATVELKKSNKLYKLKVRAYFKPSSGTVYGEFSDLVSAKTSAAANAPASNKKSDTISASKAVSAALKNAGLSRDQVYALEYELDYERGVKVYEVDFDYGRYEYSYVIDASNGKVLHSEKDYD